LPSPSDKHVLRAGPAWPVSSGGVTAPVDVQGLAADVTRTLGREEIGGLGDVAGLPGPAVRSLLEHEADLISSLAAVERSALAGLLARLEHALTS